MYKAPRPAFTLVEIIVALTLLAVGMAGLASALTADKQLRDAAQARTRMAAQLRVRLGVLAAARCTATSSGDASGISHETWGDERWRVAGTGDRVHLVDSLIPSRQRLAVRTLAIDTDVTCLP